MQAPSFVSKLTLDRFHRTMTLVVVGLVLALQAVAIAAGGKPAAIGLIALALGLLLTFAMSPCALVVDNGELRVMRRAWRPMVIPLAQIEGAAPLDTVGSGVIRLFGVGGFFGSYGLFRSDDLGKFRLYATRRGQAVIVHLRGPRLPLVLTPDDVAGAIDAIDRRPRLAE